jgi:hypothetical protein
MPDGLYEHDILAWSEHQAELLRRLGRGERVNDVDWTNLAGEIEAVGRSEWHSAESFLTLIVLHLLKLHAWPDSEACNRWRGGDRRVPNQCEQGLHTVDGTEDRCWRPSWRSDQAIEGRGT